MEKINLFEQKTKSKKAYKVTTPLADRMRPEDLNELLGQDHIIGKGKALRSAILSGEIGSIILWGPPGSGKTSLAKIIAKYTEANFVSFSAVSSGVKKIREVIEQAKYLRDFKNKKTILFIDEIHRFNKSQQDTFLPYVEDGTIILIAATTENPSFEIISPLLSRSRVYTLKALSQDDLKIIIKRSLKDKERGFGNLNIEIEPEVIDFITQFSDGDARVALNAIETSVQTTKPVGEEKIININMKKLIDVMQHKPLRYDKAGEEHYNLISALHKSLRGSDPDASLYWLARMLEGGEDPLYIARRLVRFASEDVGNADPRALQVAIAAKQAVEFIGMPEADLALAQAVTYLATAPKSNSLYKAYNLVKEDVKNSMTLPVPLAIRNAPTRLMAELGYGKSYRYPHIAPEAIVDQQYMPSKLKGRKYYFPTDRGFEREIKKRIKYWERIKENLSKIGEQNKKKS